MNFRRLSLLLAFAVTALTVSARAQLGVYGTVTVQQLATNNTNVEPIGGGGGVYYDFKEFGRFKLGADVRGTITHTKQSAVQVGQANYNSVGTRVNTLLGGARLSMSTPIHWVRPYVEGLGGFGSSNFGLSTPKVDNGLTIQTNKIYSGVAYQGFAGVDLKVAPIMDVRLIEFGIGGLTANGGTHMLKSASMGIVFHLP